MKRDTILIVDDMEVNRCVLCGLFDNKYNVIEAKNGKEALELILEKKDRIVIILLDIIMPVMDGFELLEYLYKTGIMQHIPVILITEENTTKTEKRGYDLGVNDVIGKPFEPYIVRRRVENVIDLYRHKNNLESLVEIQTDKIKAQSRKIKEINNFVIDTLSTIVEFRNLESGQHIKRIKGFTRVLLEYMSKYDNKYNLTPELIDIIASASALHDIGKIVIPDTILLKPGKLTADEFEIMKTHAIKGCEIIDTIDYIKGEPYFKYSYEICRHHHERYDGNGYPDGLKGEEIPFSAQVVSIADVYDALVSERVYKSAYSTDEAFNMILNGECGVFSPSLIECFKLARKSFEKLVDKQS